MRTAEDADMSAWIAVGAFRPESVWRRCRVTKRTFAVRLKRMRERRRISRRVLSELCGFSNDMVSRLERGVQPPTLSVVKELAEFFDVSVEYMLNGAEQEWQDDEDGKSNGR